jgi:hypothetical protein
MEVDDVAMAAATTIGSLPELVTLIAQRLRGPRALSRAACVSRVWRDAVKNAIISKYDAVREREREKREREIEICLRVAAFHLHVVFTALSNCAIVCALAQ